MTQPSGSSSQKLRQSHWACEFHIGGREEQQDAADIVESPDGCGYLLVLADGMGGHRGGSLASQTLVDVAKGLWEAHEGKPEDPGAFLKEVFLRGHDEVNRRGRERGLEPRSTLVVLVVRDNQARWAHVGDSRLYHFREGRIAFRTRDDSLVQVMLDAGEITPEEAENHPDQNRLLRSVGGEEPPRITYGASEISVKDSFLLCSDGLWEPLKEKELLALVNHSNPKAALRIAVQEAAKRGGSGADNVSALLLKVGSASTGRKSALKWATLALLFTLTVGVGSYFVLNPASPQLDATQHHQEPPTSDDVPAHENEPEPDPNSKAVNEHDAADEPISNPSETTPSELDYDDDQAVEEYVRDESKTEAQQDASDEKQNGNDL